MLPGEDLLQQALLKLNAKAGLKVTWKFGSAIKPNWILTERDAIMGKLACNCGAVMSNVDCPSENILHVYFWDEITQTLSMEPSITLWEFRVKDRTYEYWYCKSCGRVHEVNVRQGRCVRRFRPEAQDVEVPCLISVPNDWKEIFAITDIELDYITEKNFELKLTDSLPLIHRRVMFSPDQKCAIVFDTSSGMAKKKYAEEIVQDSSSNTSLDK